ncbi:MAG: fumarate/nitrate reduction transcriptional regulator Fnr [Gammaproteobacteria bacterium]|nr:fumarate/nitrate reduction transcriptional regulator Fnr [Gammaproteobacteria bacterium]
MGNEKRQIIDLSQVKAACQSCSLQELCLPYGIGPEDLAALDQIVKRKRPLSRGAHVYRTGDPFRSVYAVRSGAVKTYAVTDEGYEHVTGFHLPGELLGLDAIIRGEHTCSARALDTTSLCEIPFDQLESLAGQIRGLQRQLLRLMSQEIQQDEELLLLLGKKTAEERLATFLLSLSKRYSNLGYSAMEFNLSMSRNDIANYLGLAVETVSRLFTRFQDQGLLEVQNRYIRLHEPRALRLLAGGQHGSDDAARA